MSPLSFSSLKNPMWPQIDQTLWTSARTGGGLFDDAGLAAHWRPATIEGVEYHYGTYLWWLQVTNKLDPSQTPFARCTREVIRAFIDSYSQSHAPHSVATVVKAIYDFLRVTCPTQDASAIMRMAGRLRRKARPAKPPAQRKCSLQSLDMISETLLAEGVSLLSTYPAGAALAYRDGLTFAMETALPLRRSNFQGLQLGKTLVRRNGVYHVSFEGEDHKNGHAFEGHYPEVLTPVIDAYVNDFRPILRHKAKGKDEGWFWLGEFGQIIRGKTISGRVREITRTYLGYPLSLHAFRRSVATHIGQSDPAHVGIIKAVLGHASDLSAADYNLASANDAASKYRALRAGLLKRGKNDKGSLP